MTQHRRDLLKIFLQETKLRKEIEMTERDDFERNPLRSYKRMEQELAQRRRFFSQNSSKTLALPHIAFPGGHAKQERHGVKERSPTPRIPALEEKDTRYQAEYGTASRRTRSDPSAVYEVAVARITNTTSTNQARNSPNSSRQSEGECKVFGSVRNRKQLRRTHSERLSLQTVQSRQGLNISAGIKSSKEQQEWRISLHRRVPLDRFL